MRKFVCAPQVYKARPGPGYVTGLYTFPHDLGVEPHIVRVFFECLVAEHGYSVGDIITMNTHAADRMGTGTPGETIATGYAVTRTATDILISFDTNHGASIHKYDMKRNRRINNDAWAIIIKAYAP